MDIPKANPAFPPELSAIYRSNAGGHARSEIEKTVYYGGYLAREAVKVAIGDGPASGSNRGAFPTSVITGMRSYIAGNAIKQDIAYIFGLGAVWGKDCITLHNGIIKDILLKDPRMRLGDRIIGKGSTHEKMLERGEASELKSFVFLTDKAQAAASNATAHSLKDSLGQYIEGNYRGTGVQIYGVSIHDGYHALTLTYEKDESGSLEYHLIDNGPATSLFTGHRSFKTAQELDLALNSYVRRDTVRSYRVGRNKDQIMPARIDVYEIYPPREN